MNLETMLKDLQEACDLISIRFDNDYKWTGMVTPKDKKIISTNWQGKTVEEVVEYLWKWIFKKDITKDVLAGKVYCDKADIRTVSQP